MEPILVFPDPSPPELVRALDLADYPWKAVGGPVDADRNRPDRGWSAALLATDDDPEGAFALARHLRQVTSTAMLPTMLLISGQQLDDLEHRDSLFDDFVLTPFHPREFEARLRHQLALTGTETRAELIEHGPLVLNTETYQAAIDSRPLDLTYMEYELLKFLASSPGTVFTRETLLSRVWGYEYYGGARTVDVHVRRLRAKIGEEHAHLIQTVRSVGYSFGQSRWGAGS